MAFGEKWGASAAGILNFEHEVSDDEVPIKRFRVDCFHPSEILPSPPFLVRYSIINSFRLNIHVARQRFGLVPPSAQSRSYGS